MFIYIRRASGKDQLHLILSILPVLQKLSDLKHVRAKKAQRPRLPVAEAFRHFLSPDQKPLLRPRFLPEAVFIYGPVLRPLRQDKAVCPVLRLLQELRRKPLRFRLNRSFPSGHF